MEVARLALYAPPEFGKDQRCGKHFYNIADQKGLHGVLPGAAPTQPVAGYYTSLRDRRCKEREPGRAKGVEQEGAQHHGGQGGRLIPVPAFFCQPAG